MMPPDRKNSSPKETYCDQTSSISTFVIKIYNLLNVASKSISGSAKRIGYLLVLRRQEFCHKKHNSPNQSHTASLLQTQ